MMKFSEFVAYLDRIEATDSRLAITDIVAELLSRSSDEDLPIAALFVQGRAFAPHEERELGLAGSSVIKAISLTTGATELKIKQEIARLGDTGRAAEQLYAKKSQMSLVQKELTLNGIKEAFGKIAALEGTGTATKKIKYTADLLFSCSANEAKYLIRLILGELRVGAGEGVVRDAIAKAFSRQPEDIERAYSQLNDYGEIALMVRHNKDLSKIGIKLGRPLRPMLAQSFSSMDEAFETFKSGFWLENKYDGLRTQIHIDGDNVKIFTRRLEDVTKQFPEIVDYVKKAVNAKKAIIEGETVAFPTQQGCVGIQKPMPFQYLSRRIKRKYGIDEMVKSIPVVIFLFDITYLEGKTLIDTPLRERWSKLATIVTPIKGKLQLASQCRTKDKKEATEFYNAALAAGHEGVMVKNPEATYKPGSRVGYWYKLKPVSETLEVAIVGAEWGEGRRAKWMSSFLIACRDPDTNELLEIGKMSTGMTDEQFQYITELLKPTITEEKGKEITLKPTLVVEVGFQEIQKSPTYASGYALRFPRLIRIREDRSIYDIDTLDRVLVLK